MDNWPGGRPPEAPAAPPLARQGSIYSLTFDEFQSAVGVPGPGRDFGSMNMDELLRSIWLAEETQAMAAASAGAAAAGPSAAIQRQPSLTLPRTLSQKTVDAVWRDIMGLMGGNNTPQPPPAAASGSSSGLFGQQQQTLGEMTLEEFLVRAGVVAEPPALPMPAAVPTLPVATCPVPLGMPTNMGLSNMTHVTVTGGISSPAAAGKLVPDSVVKANRDMSFSGGSAPPVPFMFEEGFRARKGGTGVEKVVERRQRRMIKNRESAARSRARKQAYIMELEAEVENLKEMNEELRKKQAELLQKQKKQILEKLTRPPGPKRRCLRRTLTGPW